MPNRIKLAIDSEGIQEIDAALVTIRIVVHHPLTQPLGTRQHTTTLTPVTLTPVAGQLLFPNGFLNVAVADRLPGRVPPVTLSHLEADEQANSGDP